MRSPVPATAGSTTDIADAHTRSASSSTRPRPTSSARSSTARRAKLKAHSPEYVSCTFGAGGSTLSYTPETVRAPAQDARPRRRAAHFLRGRHARGTRRAARSATARMGCQRIVALRGDLPSGMGHAGDFRYATDLVEFIRARARRLLPHRSRLLSGNASAVRRRARRPAPLQGQGRRRRRRRDHAVLLQRRRVFPFRRRRRASSASTMPIVPGIMPISNFTPAQALLRMPAARRSRAGSASACRPTATTPNRSASSPPTVVADLCQRLVDGGAPGAALLHAEPLQADAEVLSRSGLNVARIADEPRC